MPLNPMLLPTVALAAALAWLAYRLWSRTSSSGGRTGLVVLSALLAVPGMLMALYYVRAFEPAAWFYEFRSTRFSELAAAGLGLLPGIAFAWLGSRKSRWGISRSGVVLASLACILTPYAKPVVFAPDYATIRDDWDGAVCRQSTPYTCGPASAATLLQHVATETQLAHECFTSRQGTENWYLARAFRNRGRLVEFVTGPVPAEPPTSCIAGVRVRGTGHFIAILQREGDRYLVGDPMVGEKWLELAQLQKAYDFTGFFMRVLK